MKQFDIPNYFKSNLISKIKSYRSSEDSRKKDFSPTVLDFGKIKFYLARHFGFCYGVQNAIEIAYSALNENPEKRIFMLSEMIHNPDVNSDLREQGINFIQDSLGNQLIPWSEITEDDIVIIPAFGTPIETEEKITSLGVDPQRYNTTCPFVEKVWNRSVAIGKNDFTVVIHGKHNHEETRATFSHAKQFSPAVIILNLEEARFLSKIILGEIPFSDFYRKFKGKFSEGFNPETDLQKIGVVNQTTMLAEETQAIADFLRDTMKKKYGEENLKSHFADNRDTLCYATNDNQTATKQLANENVDLAIVVGGYNSSNTSHLVELLEEKQNTFYIRNVKEIVDKNRISHYSLSEKKRIESKQFLPEKDEIKIALTSGASCPDSEVEVVISKILSFYNLENNLESVKIEKQI
jgi:4-hydroxy-3-methylbut-2-enyl diphosphate reductase